jgi:hypothetical protein
MNAAEAIFVQSPYPEIVRTLQLSDNMLAFANIKAPQWYSDRSEPTSTPGKSRGLFLILDAHTDMLAPGSVDSDANEFLGLVTILRISVSEKSFRKKFYRRKFCPKTDTHNYLQKLI